METHALLLMLYGEDHFHPFTKSIIHLIQNSLYKRCNHIAQIADYVLEKYYSCMLEKNGSFAGYAFQNWRYNMLAEVIDKCCKHEFILVKHSNSYVIECMKHTSISGDCTIRLYFKKKDFMTLNFMSELKFIEKGRKGYITC
jgi:hypothetical protein